ESIAERTLDDPGFEARELRHALEAFHGRKDPGAIAAAWPALGHPDRYIRFAARVAIEWQDPATWQGHALDESDTPTALTALLALARVGDKTLQPRLLQSLDRIEWESLLES